VLGGIIYVLRAGMPWRLLPAYELGCCESRCSEAEKRGRSGPDDDLDQEFGREWS
jgi:hypothetical protein